MRSKFQYVPLALLAPAVAYHVPRWTSDAVAVVDLAVDRGAPQYCAKGIVYSIPDAQDQIPDHFYTDIGLHWFRAGGAQMEAPNRGWVWDELEGRWASALSNYRTARKYDGKFQLLLHDLWGTDHADESTSWANNPKLNSLSIVGPSLSLPPAEDNTWWSNFLKYIAVNDTAPDLYTWHHLDPVDSPGNDLQNSLVTFDRMRTAAGAPEKKVNINEYLNLGDELNPAATVWWLSRFERYDTTGIRANWRGGPDGSQLRDFLASLLWRDSSDLPYQPNGDWQALKCYKTNMTGRHVSTTGSHDRKFDMYATIGDKVRVLAGVRGETGTWALTIKNLDAVGLPSSGQLEIQT
ncbi:hypothetical protein N0V90_011717 [Kalmusia sp. IMI 367209]|nr:hypothetical protein N0V90_011717 [Kalmusia sp. IMI 367209]